MFALYCQKLNDIFNEGLLDPKLLRSASRNLLRRANEKLSHVLIDVLKTTAAAEETMGLHMQSVRDARGGGLIDSTESQRDAGLPARPDTAGKS